MDESFDDNVKVGDRVTVEVGEKKIKNVVNSHLTRILRQIDEDAYLRRCVYSREKLAEYLHINKIELRQFIKDCNKDGLTFD